MLELEGLENAKEDPLLGVTPTTVPVTFAELRVRADVILRV